MHTRSTFLTAAGIALLASTARADVVTLVATKDNTLYQDPLGARSNGAGDHFFAGLNGNAETRRGLLAFDVAGALPAGATVTAATLTLHMSRTSTGPQTVSLRRALADWGEAGSDAPGNEGSGAAVETGDATWLHTFYPTSFWASAGGDFAPAASASITVSGIASYSWSGAGMVADVQAWLDSPATDFGWFVIGAEPVGGYHTTKRFDSRENPTASQRPMLTVTFTPPLYASFCSGDGTAGTDCPCANAGQPGAGCDIAQGTGGVRLDVLSLHPDGMGGGSVTFTGSGFPAMSSPSVVGLRSGARATPPSVFGDGLLCVDPPVVRFGATAAVGGTSTHAVGHGAGPGLFHYQLWFRNQPPSFCTPDAFNLSNGVTISWP
jgi:hypothetical protein